MWIVTLTISGDEILKMSKIKSCVTTELLTLSLTAVVKQGCEWCKLRLTAEATHEAKMFQSRLSGKFISVFRATAVIWKCTFFCTVAIFWLLLQRLIMRSTLQSQPYFCRNIFFRSSNINQPFWLISACEIQWSSVASLWKHGFLIALLADGKSAWTDTEV